MAHKKYIAEEKSGVQKLFRRGTSVTVLTLMDGSLAIQKEQEIFSLKEIINRNIRSKNAIYRKYKTYQSSEAHI